MNARKTAPKRPGRPAPARGGRATAGKGDGPSSSAESLGPAAEWVHLSELRPWDKNPRKNDGEPVQRVAESIKRFGFAAPLVARRATREIIAGHTRYKAAQLLGLRKVPVRFLEISEREARMLALADNKLGELADWDDAAVSQMLSGMALDEAIAAGWTPSELGKIAESLLSDIAPSAEPEAELDESFGVVIECRSEAHQTEVIEVAREKGWRCRALI